MKFKDLVLLDFVNDKTIFVTSRPISGKICDIKKGKWFQDNMLNLVEHEVRKFDYDFASNILTVTLVTANAEEQKGGRIENETI